MTGPAHNRLDDDAPSWWERLLSRPVPLWAWMLTVLLAMAALIGFGSLVRTAEQSGYAGKVAMDIATIPKVIKQLFRAPWRPYYKGSYPIVPGGFWRNTAQPLVDPGYVLTTAYDETRGRPVVRLTRLSDGRIIRDYRPDIDAINARSRFRSALIDPVRDRSTARNMMMHPLLMPDGGLIIHDSSPLARVDACGKILWVIDGIFHHSVELGADQTIWAIYRFPVPRQRDVAPTFSDEAIVNISPDGKVLLARRIADILDRNGLGPSWRNQPYVDDPFHLNDVQPVAEDGPFWRRGDLFLSLRNLSMVALYRPSTGQILWSQQGPWAMQHDVAIIDDHRISVFDNNWRFAAPEGKVDGNNRIAIFDFTTGKTSFPFTEGMKRHDIVTRAQGRATPLPNGDMMIEETERGRLVRMAADGTIRWRLISADAAHKRYELRWSRYLSPPTDGAAITTAEHVRCD